MARDPLVIDVDISALVRATEDFAIKANRGFNEAFRQGVAGMVRRAAAITPPASRNSARGNAGEDVAANRARLTKDDQARGMNAVAADIFAVFAGLGTSGSRKKRAASVEEIKRIHDRLFERKTPGRRLRSDRPNGDRYVVDEDALAQFRKRQERKVGYTASGWKAGARALGVSLPGWVNRQNASGSATIQVTGVSRRAIITNGDVPAKLDNELRRRVRWAQGAQIRAMGRLASFLTNKAAKDSRLA